MKQEENWVKAAANVNEIFFKDNGIASIKVGDKIICITKTSSGLKAFSSKCPHAGGDLSEAFCDAKQNVICPVHGYRFSLNSGRDKNGEGYFLKIYPVRENTDGIFIKLQ